MLPQFRKEHETHYDVFLNIEVHGGGFYAGYALGAQDEWPAYREWRDAVTRSRLKFRSDHYLPKASQKTRDVLEGRPAPWLKETAVPMYRSGGKP